MTLVEQVKAALKWKRSNVETAAKLGISIEKFLEIKKLIQFTEVPIIPLIPRVNKVTEWKEDLDKGTAEIKAFAVCEPRTAEEIIELLKIDTTKWKLSSYWNKETASGWMVSAMVTAIKQEPKDILAEVIANLKPICQVQPDPQYINNKFDRDCVGVISTQDLHFGKEDNQEITNHFKAAITDLVHRAYMSHHLNKIVYVIGGDLLNMDTFNGSTTSGTIVDNCQRSYNAYKDAFDALLWSIQYLRQFCDNLHVVFVPGNHDRLSSYHMAHALSKCFDTEDYSIYFDVEYSERKVVVYGHNFFAFEHGDVSKKNTALVYATEFPISWGGTKHRTCYTGHFHSKKTIEYTTENEYNGFSIKHLPSLCSTDYWHYHNKYIGAKRQAIMEIHDVEKGKVSEFVYTV